jgi:DNA adenine methylase
MASNESTRSVIRWAGSKRQLIPELRRWVPANYRRYVEPFAGSACFFFDLKPQSALLGDINGELMLTYRQLRRHPTRLFEAVDGIRRTKENYYKWRSLVPNELPAFDRATRFLFLNRNCFNAVYRVNKRGQFNVPWGSRTGATPSAIEFRACARQLKIATLITGDFETVLENVAEGDFVYLDPPYTKSVADEPGLFGAGAFDRSDLSRLINATKRIEASGATFLLSFEYDTTLLKELSSITSRVISAHRHVAGFSGSRGRVRELLFTNSRESSK